jgi:hypothetical protein
MLRALPDEFVIEYDLWLRVGFALHSFEPGEIGLALWEQFSRRCPEQALGTDFVKFWAGFSRPYSGRKLGLGWLWSHAQDAGWSARHRWDRSTSLAG